MIRKILAVTGLLLLVFFAGLVYGAAFIRSSHYGSFLLFCIVYGFLCYPVFLYGRIMRSTAWVWVPMMIVAWIGPFALGHFYGYTETKYQVWRTVQNDTDDKFDPGWKKLDRDRLFTHYAKSVDAGESGGFPAYLILMAREGWSGLERAGGAGSIHVERRGIWVWIAWGMHLVFLFVATGAAMGAAIPDEYLRRSRDLPENKKPPSFPAPGSQKTPEIHYKPPPDSEVMKTVVAPDNENEENGWWLIKASFKGKEASFRAYYPNKRPTGREFFEDIHHALYRLRSEGPLAALAVLGSVEGGLSAKEALDQFMDDDRIIRRLLGSYYLLFENDDKFFPVFFSGDVDDPARREDIKSDET
jgi:energy-coupling factor transporter transmembrane protein EcfT